MTRPVRPLLLLAPLAIGLAFAHAPGGAQTSTPAPTGRFAFADTTLLRDTLNLHFDGLFPLADSLGILPDSLRALSIRYRLSLVQITHLADSLRAPVDSVGAIMHREEFNPLSSRVQHRNDLSYTTAYSVAQTTSNWSTAADWNLISGPLFVRNTTNIGLDRFTAGGQVNLRQTRAALTEGGWRLSDKASFGARANLERFNSQNPGNYNNEAETKNEYQVSARTKYARMRNLTSELSFFSGLLDVRNTSQVKRGWSADLAAKARYARGGWLVNDVQARSSGNLARTRVPTAIQQLNTRDISNTVDGTLSMFASRPIGVNVNYGLRGVRVETPLDSARIQQIRTESGRIVTTVRMHRDNDRYLNITERLGRSASASATNLSSLNRRGEQSFNLQGRYRLDNWFLDASFDNSYSNTQFPQRSAAGGYGDKSDSRVVQATATRTFGSRFTFKADGRVGLTSSRYYIIGSYPNPPVDRDQYRQSYKLDGQYNRSQRMSTGVSLETIRDQFVNIPSASTGANNETRSYRSEWRWTYHLLRGLTATQRNQLSADYVAYNFLPVNNRLSLSYKALTTLNAIVSPRTTIEITHDAQITPSGNYTALDDGIEYFRKADEGRNFTLRARVAYSPSALFSLNVQSDYSSNQRFTVTDAGELPQRDTQSLNFSGGGNLNIPLGVKGRLSGDVRRSYRADRSLTFQSGVPQPSSRSEQDYWNGRLELSWAL